MRAIGDRLNNFDNNETQTVGEFNKLFDDVPLVGYDNNDNVVIGEITANANTRLLLINNIATEHCFVRRSNSENDYNDSDNDNSNDDY